MKILLALFTAIFTSLANAQVLEVNIWQPNAGGAAATLAAAKEARAIVSDAGGTAGIGIDLDGSFHFITTHENWAAWAAQASKLAKSEAWNGFVSRWNDNPSATLEENYLLNTPAPGGAGDVYQVFIWEALPGGNATLFKSAMEAKALHEKDGAAVTIHSDQMNRLHYAMSFDDWDAWAKFQDADHPEFDAFMQKTMESPSATLIDVYTASMQ